MTASVQSGLLTAWTMGASQQLRPQVTFIEQNAPVDECGRALYAIARSVLRAFIDSITNEDLTDLNTPIDNVTMRQLAKIARPERDKGMKGDGFEWAVHEAIAGMEPNVIDPVLCALQRACRKVKDSIPTSLRAPRKICFCRGSTAMKKPP